MTFSKLSQYFEKLESTASRLALIDILSELFVQIDDPQEIEKVCYLVQGRIAPFFEPLEIGMAEKTVAKALAIAYNETPEEVLKVYDRLGDMGLAVEKLSANHPHKGDLSINDVFAILTTIANTSGEGTIEKKVNLLIELLQKVNSVSAKYLVRIPLGNLRLGIGDPTVLDALAKAKFGDKTNRKLLEGAYNRTSDLGLIAKTLWSHKNPAHALAAVEKLEVTVGKPIRSELCERLPNPEKVIEKMGEVDVQYKYDGFRCVTAYTPIYVKEKGIIAMRDLQIGEQVLTDNGTFKKIVAKQKRTIKKNERLFQFQTYLGEKIEISEGHPVLCLVNNQKVWVSIETIKPGDEVIFPLPQFPANNPHPAPKTLQLQTISGYKKTFIFNGDFYRFLGFWIGDGFTNDFHNTERVGLTFNAKTEQDLANVYEAIIKKNLQAVTVSRSTRNGGLNLYWRDEPLKHWLSSYFRREWQGKMLPSWFVHVSKKHFAQFLQGWIESDGSIDKDGVTKIITKERDLAALAQLIGLSHGIIIGLHYIRIKNNTYYQLVIPKTNRKARIVDNQLIVKVYKNKLLEKRDPRIQLYDIQVEDNESFCVPMVTLHNCQIHKNGNTISIFSRNLESMTHMFPELIEGARKQIKAKSAILDTEALAYNPESEEFLPFQETTKRRRKYNIEEIAKQLPLKAFAFDILYKNGKSLIEKPLTERLAILKQTIETDDILIPAKNQTMKDPKKLGLMLADAITKGLEGLVVKKLASPYEAGGRNFNWVKLKRHSSGELHDTIDCVILGYIFGRGKRTAFGAGALLVGLYDKDNDEFVTVSKIGTGLSDEEWRSIKERTKGLEIEHKPARVHSLIIPSVWVKPEIVIEVLADEITRSPIHTAGEIISQQDGKEIKEPGYALRFPRLVSFRDKDKTPEDATSVKELIEMYEQQGKK